MYEPGITVAILDEVFGELRKKIVPWSNKSQNQPINLKQNSYLNHFTKEKQREFSLEILRTNGI